MAYHRLLVGLWRSHAQTSERHPDVLLRTRHYPYAVTTMGEKLLLLLPRIPRLHVEAYVPQVGEITAIRRTPLGRIQDLSMTLVATADRACALDLYAASRGPWGDFGENARTIITILQCVDDAVAVT